MSDAVRRQEALSNVIFALRHGKKGTDLDERVELADFDQDQPYLDITIDDHPYRLVLEDHGD